MTATTKLYGNYSSAAQFYVFVGVMAFLYCIGIVLFYVFGDDKYRNFEIIPIIVSAVYFSRIRRLVAEYSTDINTKEHGAYMELYSSFRLVHCGTQYISILMPLYMYCNMYVNTSQSACDSSNELTNASI